MIHSLIRRVYRIVSAPPITIGSLLALASPAPSPAQFADSLSVRHAGGMVYMIEGAGDIIGVSIGPDGLLLVDNGFPETVNALRTTLKELGAASPRYIVNTHWHHAGANEAFGHEAVIIAHQNVRERLSDTSLMYGQTVPPKPPVALPQITFTDTLRLYFNGEEIRLLHLPRAHTDSDIAVFFTKSNVVQLGDVFVTLIPVTDYTSGGRLLALLSSIDELLAWIPRDVTIIPGHGHLATYDDLQSYRDMLGDMVAHVRARRAAQTPLGQIVEEGVPSQWRHWLRLLPEEFVIRNFYEGLVLDER